MGNFSKVRAAIDWADKGYICLGAKPTDALNLLPYAPYWRATPRYIITAGASVFFRSKSVLTSNQSSPYGGLELVYQRIGGAVTDYIIMGDDNAGNRTWVVSPSTTYAITVFYAAISGSAPQLTNTLVYVELWNGTSWVAPSAGGSSNLNTQVLATFALGTKVTFTFTTPTGVTRMRLIHAIPTTGITVNLRIQAAMLTASGAVHPEHYNDGQTLSLYDDVTTSLKEATWQVGRTDYMAIMPSEGTASITLNNSTKLFSPEITTSALYGYMKSNRRFGIYYQSADQQDLGTDKYWYTEFMGWVEKFDVTTSVYRERETKITASQGVKNLEKMRIRRRFFDSSYATTYYWLQFGLRGGYPSAKTGYSAATVGKSYVGHSGIQQVSDIADLSEAASGSQNMDQMGQLWDNDNDTGETLLREWADFENGYVFLTKDGIWMVRPYSTISLASSVATLNLSEVTAHDYQYGGEKWTAYRVTPNFWGAFGSYPSNVIYISEWTEWQTIKAGGTALVDTPYSFDGDFTPLGVQYAQHTTQDSQGRRTDDNSIAVAVDVGELYYVGQKYDDMYNPITAHRTTMWGYVDRFYVRNVYAYDIDFRVRAQGVGLGQTTGTEVIVSDDAMALEHGYLENKFENRIATNQTLFNYYVANKLRKRGTDRGWYSMVEIVPTDTNKADLISTLDLGMVVVIENDPQTRNGADLKHCIIGASGHWTPQDITYNYYLQPIF